MPDPLLLVGGGLLLYFGAEWLVGGASKLALALRVPQLIVGLTVVAYGTSAPEVIVGIQAAAGGHGDVALGNVIGSNVANIGLILGLSTLVRPAKVNRALQGRELPMLVLTMLAVPLLLLDGIVSRAEGAGLLLVAIVYTVWMAKTARAGAQRSAKIEVEITAQAADAGGGPGPRGLTSAAVTALVGLGVLLIGGSLFVTGATGLARSAGISERVVGLTIVAIGTSLPELVTSLIAARRGHSDIAVGNVIGSNIFNVLLCLGSSALAGSVGAAISTVRLDLIALAGMTLLAAFFIRTERVVSRVEGTVLLTGYAAFLVAVAL